MKKFLATAFVASALLALSACSNSGDSDPGSNSLAEAMADVPDCDDVWVVGETLVIDGYEGCMIGDTLQVAVSLEWGDGCVETSLEDRLWVLNLNGKPGVITDVRAECPR